MGCLKFETKRKQSKQTVHHNNTDDDDEKKSVAMIGKEGLRRFSWEEVENCTQNFSHVIGSGGFSTVYMGKISGGGGGGGNSGLAAAFKISAGSERLNLVFKQELLILTRLHHHNVVKLLGYSDHREEGVLVFEHVSGGTLQEKLHNPNFRKKSTLSWKTRVSIAFQLIQAIEYLHETCAPHIVHGDIKASNILLTSNHSVKLCDFGSAKAGFSSSIAPSSPSSLRSPKRQITMMGSPGYADPHYLRTGLASKKNDIYSYGVVLLELITGKTAFCSESHKHLATVMGPMLNDGECEGIDVSTLVDTKLCGNFDVEEVMALCHVSAQCLRSLPSLRPSSTQIMKTMKQRICSIL